MVALAQELAPPGAEASALALPRAAGDGAYIVAPFLVGLVTDASSKTVPGAECAAAGLAVLAGSGALALLSRPPPASPR
jgi:MFS-type transporter involved in bile tolerance (Atg22 family)